MEGSVLPSGTDRKLTRVRGSEGRPFSITPNREKGRSGSRGPPGDPSRRGAKEQPKGVRDGNMGPVTRYESVPHTFSVRSDTGTG